ncbi:hypothetical protein F5890DRAFT_1463984 [Lentinula detonsa]|uniref:MYND-type domain-containing protein n=1 Tax=Lentinula detonsa TaxID=2804962 RepID=A0AA38PWE2_9AGAR|nr:hypothetical protein F5890DRAFT_1463984 [Lentinula detonsa]
MFYEPVVDEPVLAGSFIFCRAHGCEFCHECFSDHRFTNNFQIMDKLYAAFPALTEAYFMVWYNKSAHDRPPISYVFDKAVARTSQHSRKLLEYECKEHHALNCPTCFNWAAIAIENIKRQAKVKNSKVIPVDIPKEEKLKFLKSMGVDLSPATRLPNDTMERKFRCAIDASQSLTTLIAKAPFDPSNLPLWSKKTCKKSLLETVGRGNVKEGFANFQARLEGRSNAWDLYENPFMDVRQTIMGLANGLDNGAKTAIIQDKETAYAICIRVVEVYMLNDETPVMVILYCRGTRDSPAYETFDWVQQVITDGKSPVLEGTATPEEQKLLLAVLNANARRLSSTYSVKRNPTGTEATFALSFLLPLGPINQRDIARLTHHTGCVVCGGKTVSICSQCLAMEYCGAECQRVHWKEHKPTCNSVQGGEWVEVTFSMYPTKMRLVAAKGNKVSMATWNNMSRPTMDNMRVRSYEDEPPLPPNIHSQNLFLIKMQREIAPGMPQIMIYDRTRSIEVYLCHDLDSKGHEKTMAQMHTGQMGLKIYRWAKRTSGDKLSVCLNKAPPKDPQW